ncbi:MAG TPA: DUF3108 domain-containing protein [Steroidobacteraceae bacterium]|jgi:hypothetical protein|nr:DUF3108 domain-containing protein [Steroidobacteraceae bacterium]
MKAVRLPGIRGLTLAYLLYGMALASGAAGASPADAGGASEPVAGLRPFEASYSWSWHGATVAISTLKLDHRDGEHWTYSSSGEPRGIGYLYPIHPALVSQLRVTAEGVQPLSFKADAGSASRNADVTFDWAGGRVTGSYEGVTLDMASKPGLQDDLSVQVALMVDLLRDQPPETLWMLDKNAVRDYRYKREGTERIDTPFGPVDTVIYSSQHPGSPRITRFWCAPSKGYLPMRVEQKRLDSVEWTMKVRTLQFGSTGSH